MMNTESFETACKNAGLEVYSKGFEVCGRTTGKKPRIVAEYFYGDPFATAVGAAWYDPTALEEALKNI